MSSAIHVGASDWQPLPDWACAEFAIPTDVQVFRAWIIDANQQHYAVATSVASERQYPDLLRAKERNCWLDVMDRIDSGGKGC